MRLVCFEGHNSMKHTKEIQFGTHTLTLETGEIARQADGAVFASMGGTQVLVTVVGKKTCLLYTSPSPRDS